MRPRLFRASCPPCCVDLTGIVFSYFARDSIYTLHVIFLLVAKMLMKASVKEMGRADSDLEEESLDMIHVASKCLSRLEGTSEGSARERRPVQQEAISCGTEGCNSVTTSTSLTMKASDSPSV
jgi:hypothetical protein